MTITIGQGRYRFRLTLDRHGFYARCPGLGEAAWTAGMGWISDCWRDVRDLA